MKMEIQAPELGLEMADSMRQLKEFISAQFRIVATSNVTRTKNFNAHKRLFHLKLLSISLRIRKLDCFCKDQSQGVDGSGNPIA